MKKVLIFTSIFIPIFLIFIFLLQSFFDQVFLFALITFFTSFLAIILSKNKLWKDFLWTACIVLSYCFLAKIYWLYADGDLCFLKNKNNCNDPVKGWFSFENELRYSVLVNAGLIAFLFATFVKKIIFKFKK